MSVKSFVLSTKVLIKDKDNLYLFLKRSQKSAVNSGLWDLPGGKMEKGETFEECLVREVYEETGLTINLTCVIGATEEEWPSLTL